MFGLIKPTSTTKCCLALLLFKDTLPFHFLNRFFAFHVVIIMYLVNGTSAYTLEQFKSYKSLEAYNYVVSGWIDHVNTYKPEGCANVIVTAKVSHSQRLNAKPLEPWMIASPQGTVLSAHCTCMAGLVESCSHVAALLFYIEEMQKYRERVSVTGKLAYWKKPSKKSVEYKELS
ncbi:hypothetical protein ACJMK2_025010 [Sinanodonta woodiana]|uniref:SWIM-type domain-containing protein n=1 Tax=Sinanodonta woodiana TaxID=1069815 RepID=A0ABD3XH30_SINWO